jgi:hypothetical protein
MDLLDSLQPAVPWVLRGRGPLTLALSPGGGEGSAS